MSEVWEAVRDLRASTPRLLLRTRALSALTDRVRSALMAPRAVVKIRTARRVPSLSRAAKLFHGQRQRCSRDLVGIQSVGFPDAAAFPGIQAWSLGDRTTMGGHSATQDRPVGRSTFDGPERVSICAGAAGYPVDGPVGPPRGWETPGFQVVHRWRRRDSRRHGCGRVCRHLRQMGMHERRWTWRSRHLSKSDGHGSTAVTGRYQSG